VFEPTRRAESTNTGGPSHSRQDRPRLVDDWATPDTTCINWSPSIKPATDTAYTRLSQDSTSTPDTSHNTSPNYTFDSRCGILYDMPNPPRMPELSAYANVARLSSPSLELSRIPLPEPIVIQQRAALVPWISPQLGQTRHAEVERITEEVNGNRSMTESQSLHLPAPTTSMASKSVGMYSSKIELPFRLRTRHEETYSGTTNNTPSRIDIDDESTYDSYDDESAYDSCDLLSEPCDADSPNENTRGDGQHQSVSVNHETVSTGSNNKADKGTSLKRRWGGDADDDDNSSNKDRRNAKGGKYDHEYPCPFGQADPARYDSDACSRNTSQGISHLWYVFC
jgi:hypothetical protein